MLNNLVSTTAGTAVLYSSMLVYLALGMTTTQYALRQSVDTILVGEGAGFTWRRHVSWASSQLRAGCVRLQPHFAVFALNVLKHTFAACWLPGIQISPASALYSGLASADLASG